MIEWASEWVKQWFWVSGWVSERVWIIVWVSEWVNWSERAGWQARVSEEVGVSELERADEYVLG